MRVPGLASTSGSHAAAATRLWLDFVAAPPAAALAEPRFPVMAQYATRILLETGHAEEALRVNTLALEALDRGPRGGPPNYPALQAGASLLDVRINALRSLGRPAEALDVLKNMLRMRAAIPVDSDAALAASISKIGDLQEAALLAADIGDFRFAEASLADGERFLVEAEDRWGARAFGSQRVEIEWARGRVLERRAAKTSPSAERRRLLAVALSEYRAAVGRAERLGGAGQVHGIDVDRLEGFKRDKERVEAMLASR
jgi:hypothetical protein